MKPSVLDVLRWPALGVLELLSIPIAASDDDGRVLYVNPAFCSYFRTSADRVVGRRVPEELPETERSFYLTQLDRWRRGEAVVARMSFGSDARTPEPFLVIPAPILRDGKDCLGIVVAMVPERAVVEAASSHVVQMGSLVRSVLGSLARELEHTLRHLPPSDPDLEAVRSRVPVLRALSRREWDVARRIATGQRVASVAHELSIRPSTVRNHLKAIFRKTGVSSQGALVERLRAWQRESPNGVHPVSNSDD